MVKVTSKPGSLRLRYQVGTTPEGKELFKTRLMGNINPQAGDEAVYGMKALLEEVQNNPVSEISRVETKIMTQE